MYASPVDSSKTNLFFNTDGEALRKDAPDIDPEKEITTAEPDLSDMSSHCAESPPALLHMLEISSLFSAVFSSETSSFELHRLRNSEELHL